MAIKVELRPHIGQMATAIGVVDVEHDQWVVLAGLEGNSLRQVGYLGKKPGSHVQPVVDLPDSAWEAIRVELASMTKTEIEPVSPLMAIDKVVQDEEEEDTEIYTDGEE